MVVALGTDILIALNIGPVEYRVALDALFPQTFWNTAGRFTSGVTAHTGRQNLVNPAHGLPHHPVEGGIINAVRFN